MPSSSGSLALLASLGANVQLKKTPLYDFNVSRGGKMVPFAGFSMPLSYGDVGQVMAHKHVRSDAGLFDVSHMLQHIFSGPGATAFLESLTPTALSSLPEHGSSLTVLLNEDGGIIDDSIMTRHPNGEWYVVTNAGRIAEDTAHIKKELEKWEKNGGDKVEWKTLDGYGLVALQGPKAAEELQKITDADLSKLKFGMSTYANVGKDKTRCHIARGGYTGEDGFEVSRAARRAARAAILFPAFAPMQASHGFCPSKAARRQLSVYLELTPDLDPARGRRLPHRGADLAPLRRAHRPWCSRQSAPRGRNVSVRARPQRVHLADRGRAGVARVQGPPRP